MANAPLEGPPRKITKALQRDLARARQTAEVTHVLTMEEATAQATVEPVSFLDRVVRAALFHRGFYTCMYEGKRTLYIRADVEVIHGR